MLCFVLFRMETHGTPTPAPSVTVGRDTSHATRSPAQSVLRDRSLSSTPGSAAETVNHVRSGPCNQCKDRPQNGNDQIIFCLFVFFLWVPGIFFWGGGGLKQNFFFKFFTFFYPEISVFVPVLQCLQCSVVQLALCAVQTILTTAWSVNSRDYYYRGGPVSQAVRTTSMSPETQSVQVIFFKRFHLHYTRC